MWKIVIGGILLGSCFWLIGLFVPGAALLNFSFGVGYYLADRFGLWKPGLMWGIENHGLLVLCFFVWPMLVSLVLGIFASAVSLRLRNGTFKWARPSGIIFILALFGLILSVRIDPAEYFISYFGYWTSNY